MPSPKKTSSYQKLKQQIKNLEIKNEGLNRDIYNLIRNPEEIEGITTKIKYETVYVFLDEIWQGDTTTSEKIDGFLKIAIENL